MKYIKRLLLFTVLLIAVDIHKTYATSGSVTTDGVRMRKAPSTDAEIITVLNKSAQIEIVEESGDWYKVSYTWNGNYEGYIRKDLVTKQGGESVQTTATPIQTPVPASTPEPTPQPTSEASNKPEVITLGDKITNEDTKVYILPSISSNIKDTIKKNTAVTVYEIAGNFVYVKYNNEYGFIRSNVLQESVQQATQDNNQTTTSVNTEKIGYINVTQAIVRSKATTNSELITSLNYNTEVHIVGEESDFYKIKINGTEAYIAKRLISDTKQQTSNRSSVERKDTAIVDNIEKEIETDSVIVTETKNDINIETKSNTVPVSPIGEEIASMAKSYLGYKYVYGGASPSTGFDCSGLVYYICGKLGYNVNRTADTQINNGIFVEKSDLQPGDLVFFSNYKTYTGIGHVGIYIGNNQFVHASTATTGVIISSLNNDDYVKRYVTARRIK